MCHIVLCLPVIQKVTLNNEHWLILAILTNPTRLLYDPGGQVRISLSPISTVTEKLQVAI